MALPLPERYRIGCDDLDFHIPPRSVNFIGQLRSRTIQTVSLTLFRFTTRRARLWAFAQMGFARLSLRRIEGMTFHKLCGTGTGEGFTPRPNWGVYTLLATWPDRETAEKAIENAPFFRRYRAHAAESCLSKNGPIAALTRASIKPRILLKFWRHVPNISAMIGTDQNVKFKIGMGEIPLLHQITFSVWPDTQSMAAFARQGSPHANAIKAVRAGDWFAEELYARFDVIAESGTWEGRPPLSLESKQAA